MGCNLHIRIKLQGTLPGHLCLALADVLLVEQELPVQIAHIDRVQVDLKASITGLEMAGTNKKSHLRFRFA